MIRMAEPKKKPGRSTSGKHTGPRRAVQLPAAWVDVADLLAKKRPMPTMWYIVDLLRKEAESAQVETPPLPWE